MKRLSLLAILSFSALQLHLSAGGGDLRNIVTGVDRSTRTVTITAMENHHEMVEKFADPTVYPSEVIINGEQKKFENIVEGLQYMSSIEVSAGVIESISLRNADPAP